MPDKSSEIELTRQVSLSRSPRTPVTSLDGPMVRSTALVASVEAEARYRRDMRVLDAQRNGNTFPLVYEPKPPQPPVWQPPSVWYLFLPKFKVKLLRAIRLTLSSVWFSVKQRFSKS